jgi:hypothetical protein
MVRPPILKRLLVGARPQVLISVHVLPVSGACLGSGRQSRSSSTPWRSGRLAGSPPSRWGRRHRMRQSRQIRPAWPSRSSEDVLHRDSNTVVLATLRPPVDALQSGLTGRKRKVAGGERAVSESRLEDRSLNHRNSAAGLQRRLWRTSDEGSSVPSVQGRWEPVRARASYPLESKARTAAHAGRSASGE